MSDHDDPTTGHDDPTTGHGDEPAMPAAPATPVTTPVSAAPPETGAGTGPGSGSGTGTGTGSSGQGDPGRERRGFRVRTVVFGLVMLAISVTSLVTLLTPVHLDAATVGLALLIGAGAALLLGGLSAAIRDVRRGGARFG